MMDETTELQRSEEPAKDHLTLPEWDVSNPPESGENGENLSGKRAEGVELTAVYDIPVQVSAVLGRATMQISELLKLGRGAVIELDRKVGEAIDIYVNNRLVARGEVILIEEHLGVTMTEIIKTGRNQVYETGKSARR